MMGQVISSMNSLPSQDPGHLQCVTRHLTSHAPEYESVKQI